MDGKVGLKAEVVSWGAGVMDHGLSRPGIASFEGVRLHKRRFCESKDGT